MQQKFWRHLKWIIAGRKREENPPIFFPLA
jgi:hypothetical protein